MTSDPSHMCSCTSNQHLHAGRIEALGDLAHYHMAVAAMVTRYPTPLHFDSNLVMASDPSHTCSCTSNQHLCTGEIKALGDLAHYHQAVAAMLTRYPTPLHFDGTHLGVEQSRHDPRSLTYVLLTQYLHAGRIEALGDLAHYRRAVAAMVTGSQGPNPEELTTAGISTDLSRTQQCCG